MDNFFIRQTAGKLYLHQLGKPEKFIGQIQNNILFLKRNNPKTQILHYCDGIGINWNLLHNPDFKYKHISIQIGNSCPTVVTREFFKENAIIKQFSAFEKQAFLTFSKLNQKPKPETQPSLFDQV